MILWQIVAVLLMFTVVVAIHELGHFLFARWRGMEVEEFAIGFGKKLLSRTARSGTEFTIRIVPLGGFVRIKGMIPQPDASEEKISGGFYAQGLGSQALVLFAGPLFSVLGGFFLFFSNYAAFGEPVASEEPLIGGLEAKWPADTAGLRKGDRVLSIDGRPMETYADIRLVTQDSADKELTFSIDRAGENLELRITPKLSTKELPVIGPDGEALENPGGELVLRRIGQIGVLPLTEFRRVSVGGALGSAGAITWRIIYETPRVLFNPSRLKQEAAGPITIARVAGKAAGEGLAYLVWIAAVISVSLGLINLLPVPAILDGGKLLIVGVEALRGGRRLSFRSQEILATVGIVMLAMMILGVLMLDGSRLLQR